MEIIERVIAANGLIFAFLVVGVITIFSYGLSRLFKKSRMPGSAIAIIIGLGLSFLGNENGIADIPLFAGMAILGGSMFRDFAVVSTAIGADLEKIKQSGLAGVISLFVGVFASFFIGAFIAVMMGYDDAKSITTIGAGACTYLVGPVTGTAIGASSDVIALSVATGVIKTIFVTIITPLVAKTIQLDNPHAAIVFGGLMGTTSGTVAGLAATDEKLVPFGAITATFYTGLGCLLCPSILYLLVKAIY